MMNDEAKTWWLVCGPDGASSYFLKKIHVVLESLDSHLKRQYMLKYSLRISIILHSCQGTAGWKLAN